MPTKRELEEQLAALMEEYGVDDEPSLDPNGYYDPEVIHIAGKDGGYLCGEEPHKGSWNEKFLDDKVASKLPKCPNCLAMYEQLHGVAFGEAKVKSAPKGIEPPPKPLANAPTGGAWADKPWLWDNGLTISRVPNQ